MSRALPRHRSSACSSSGAGLATIGAPVCLRKSPRCDACPVARDCVARRDGRVDELPAPRPKRDLPLRTVSVLLLQRHNEVLLERRPAIGIWAGLWSLPELAPDAD